MKKIKKIINNHPCSSFFWSYKGSFVIAHVFFKTLELPLYIYFNSAIARPAVAAPSHFFWFLLRSPAPGGNCNGLSSLFVSFKILFKQQMYIFDKRMFRYHWSLLLSLLLISGVREEAFKPDEGDKGAEACTQYLRRWERGSSHSCGKGLFLSGENETEIKIW